MDNLSKKELLELIKQLESTTQNQESKRMTLAEFEAITKTQSTTLKEDRHIKDEKVRAYRKQVEYGPKKFIKP